MSRFARRAAIAIPTSRTGRRPRDRGAARVRAGAAQDRGGGRLDAESCSASSSPGSRCTARPGKACDEMGKNRTGMTKLYRPGWRRASAPPGMARSSSPSGARRSARPRRSTCDRGPGRRRSTIGASLTLTPALSRAREREEGRRPRGGRARCATNMASGRTRNRSTAAARRRRDSIAQEAAAHPAAVPPGDQRQPGQARRVRDTDRAADRLGHSGRGRAAARRALPQHQPAPARHGC